MLVPYFHNALRIEQVGWSGGRPTFMTLCPLIYTSERLGTTVVVPAEFITDLASTPRLLLTWFVAGGRAPRPAVVHDHAYQTGMLPLKAGGRLEVNRSQADAVFYEAMKADPISGTGWLTRNLMWAGVRVGGWLSWNRQAERVVSMNPVWSFEGWPTAPVEAP